MHAMPKLLLALAFAAGPTLACDRPPSRLTGPEPPTLIGTPLVTCNGNTTTAKRIPLGWDVTVFVPTELSCDAYPCTISDATHALTPQQAIVECRRISGVTGSHA